jgi:hypothetical protein
MVMLLIGLIAGAFVASVVWMIVGSGKKKAFEAAKREKEELMLSIGRLLADADAIEANFRSGALPRAAFTRALGDKVNEITRALRTNMHSLEVFFVKYAEQQAEEYMRLIENPERRKFPAAGVGAASVGAPPADVFEAPASEEVLEEFGAGPVAEEFGIGGKPETGFVVVADVPEPAVEAFDIEIPAPVGEGAVDVFVAPEPEPAPPISAPPESAPPESAPPETVPPAPAPPETEAPLIVEASPVAAGAPEEPPVAELVDEDVFELPAAASPAPQEAGLALGDEPAAPAAKAEDAWAEQSLEDYEAAFAKFEGQPAEPGKAETPADMYGVEHETGDFSVNEAAEAAAELEDFEASLEKSVSGSAELEIQTPPAAKTPVPEAVAAGGDDDVFDISAPPAEPPEPDALELTETISFDRSAMLAGMAAATPTYATPPIHQGASPEEPPKEEKLAEQGITGDDVVDSIDSFFKLK